MAIQPVLPMLEAEVAECASVATDWSRTLSAGAPLLLTYMSHLTGRWPLGTSAALHGLPLAVIGLGREWGGPGIRVPAVLRAAQLMDVLSPDIAMVSTDGSDVLVANIGTNRWAGELGELVRKRQMLMVHTHKTTRGS